MTTSTICHDEPKFYLNLMHFDVVVYVTHSVNANNMKEGNDNLVLKYHTIPYIYSNLGVPIFKLYLYGKFCVKRCVRHL